MSTPAEPSPKRPRTGVGSSVATLVPGPADPFVVTMTKIKVQRLLPRGKKVVTADTFETLPQIFKRMVDHNVLSLPVLNQKGKYYGVIEMFDMVEYILTLFTDVAVLKFVDLEKLLKSEKKFTNATVRDVLKRPQTTRNSIKPITKGFSLFTAWEILALAGVHRIPIIDENNEVCDLITQSMLVDFLWQNIEKIGKLADTLVQDLNSEETEAMSTIKLTTRTIDAFREMVKNNKGGVAIVNDDGCLVDNLSVRDLRGIHSDAEVFWRLWSTAGEYKGMVRKDFPDKTPAELVYALPTDTFFSVVEKMAKLHIHRIYVVESTKSLKPVRVITQTDILKEILAN